MSVETPINDVSDTSFWVAYYRAKETERTDALFRDPLAKRLTGERGKMISEAMADISRYTEWSVVSRTVIIDRFLQALIREGVDAVINLGAGLDTRPYRLDLPPELAEKLQWIEADYPQIINYKNSVLGGETPRMQLTRKSVDLANDDARREFLQEAAPGARCVLVLTEGVIPYLSAEQVTALAHDLASDERVRFWVMEYFHKRVYKYLKRTVRTLKMRNAPFRFYPDDWYGFFAPLGWKPRETRYAGEIAREFNRRPPMPTWVRWILPFLPGKVKKNSMTMAGFVLFERAPARPA